MAARRNSTTLPRCALPRACTGGDTNRSGYADLAARGIPALAHPRLHLVGIEGLPQSLGDRSPEEIAFGCLNLAGDELASEGLFFRLEIR